MRTPVLPVALALLAFAPFAPACSDSTGSVATSGDDGGQGDALPAGADGGQAIPATLACKGAASSCLSGKGGPRGFQAAPKRMAVQVFRVFPSGSAQPIASTPVALDGTWALDGLPAWGHYYAQIEADFGGTVALSNVVGPLAVPSSGPVDLHVEPAQIVVAEAGGASGYAVQWAQAHVFDPASGSELTSGVSVAVTVGGASTPMPWTTTPSGQMAYFARFGTPPPAQATYTVTTSGGAFGSAPASWQLTAAAPAFAAAVTSPSPGATVPAGQPLTVRWPAQPEADYVLVELYRQSMGQWAGAYGSPAPDAPDATQETIPGADTSPAGAYLLNLDVSTASCPPAADGCVLASTAASVQLTAQ